MAQRSKYTLRLLLSAKELLRSLNPVCTVTLIEETERELLRTGPAPQTCAPIWQEHLRLGVHLWDVRRIRVEIYDTEGEQGGVIASVSLSLGWLLRHERGEVKMQPEGVLVLSAELLPENHSLSSLYLKLSAKELRQMDLIGTNDPYFVLSHPASSTILYTSEVIDNETSPLWKPLHLSLTPAILSDPLHLTLYDKDLFGSDYIGSLETSYVELTEGGPELRLRDKAGLESGIVRIEAVRVTEGGEFLREIRAGLSFEVCFGVDLGWGCGGFHTADKASNPYFQAISGISQALEPYTDDPFSLFGFGGRQGHQDEGVTHWSLSSVPILGTESLLRAYSDAVSHSLFPCPRKLLSPLLQEFRLKVLENTHHFYILIVLSCGHYHDLDDIKEELRLLSALPVSLLLVGIGDLSGYETTSLDSNSALLVSPSGTALRDCVAYEIFPSESFPTSLLSALPRQVQDYRCL